MPDSLFRRSDKGSHGTGTGKTIRLYEFKKLGTTLEVVEYEKNLIGQGEWIPDPSKCDCVGRNRKTDKSADPVKLLVIPISPVGGYDADSGEPIFFRQHALTEYVECAEFHQSHESVTCLYTVERNTRSPTCNY